jgi:hypothetical protein
MSAARICEGSDVAIIPSPNSQPSETLEIAQVYRVGLVIIELTDGRLYATSGLKGLTAASVGYLAPASDSHREAVINHAIDQQPRL